MKREAWLDILNDRARKRYAGVDIAVKAFAEPNTSAGIPSKGQPFQIEGYATTDAVDLEREVILPDGIDIVSYFQTNRSMFVDHDYDILSCVGKCRNLKITPKGIICTSILLSAMGNPKRDWVQALASEYQVGHSVVVERISKGAPTAEEAKKYPGARLVTRTSRLIEISYTAIPMNGECQAMGVAVEAMKALHSPVKPKRTIVFLNP